MSGPEGGLIEMSVEAYYKITQNTIDYKSGATLILNHHIETDIVKGNGKAYGVEFMIKKAEGKEVEKEIVHRGCQCI